MFYSLFFLLFFTTLPTDVHEAVGGDALTAFKGSVEGALGGEPAHEGDVFQPTDAATQYLFGVLHTVPVD